MQQAWDFLEESRDLEKLLAPLTDKDFERQTAFKSWSFNQILRHLHIWNYAADLSLQDAGAFKEWITDPLASIGKGALTDFERDFLNGESGTALLKTWAGFYPGMVERFSQIDPGIRLEWAGPSMSARSSITARLMETWAHGQAIYDELGIVRKNTDRIKNIVVLGYNTYGWTFKNRGLEPPDPCPQLILTAPSGNIWTFGEEAGPEKIEGLAEEFCQVVTQTRNIADTGLSVSGPNAEAWMQIAQCFAGPPNDPPMPGLRRTRTS
tara:strand:+ start:1299 stop:2096 length:798 start_codon:yes stop_codon:yes gene_type:complete